MLLVDGWQIEFSEPVIGRVLLAGFSAYLGVGSRPFLEPSLPRFGRTILANEHPPRAPETAHSRSLRRSFATEASGRLRSSKVTGKGGRVWGIGPASLSLLL